MPLSQLKFDNKNTATTLIAGKAGDIEVLITLPELLTESTPIAVISHPHPLYGGSMTNKVVHILAKSFNELDAITVRFNFRGVGKSAGTNSPNSFSGLNSMTFVSSSMMPVCPAGR